MEKTISVWVAADTGESLSDIRAQAIRENEALGLSNFSLSLPQHISLKISFSLPESRFEAAVERIMALLSGKGGFSVRIRGVERNGNILWIAMEQEKALCDLHGMLDEAMEKEFGVTPHPFDGCYLFHSTLFMDENVEKLEEMALRLRDFPLPSVLPIHRFLIGCSREEEPGVYRVIRQFA